MWLTLQQVLVYILYFILSVFFSLQAKDVFEAYQQKKTMFSISLNDRKHLQLPAITLCPGNIFNVVKLKKKYNSTIDPMKGLASSIESLNQSIFSLFEESSYILNKDLVIEYEDLLSSTPDNRIPLLIGLNLVSSDIGIDVSTLYTFNNGLCYVIITNASLNGPFAPFALYAKFLTPLDEVPEKFIIFLGAKEEMHGLTYTSFKGSMPYSDDLAIGKASAIFLNKRIWKYLSKEGGCQSNVTSVEYRKCFADEFTKVMLKTGMNCSFNGANELYKLSGLDLKECSLQETSKSTVAFLQSFPVATSNCITPCQANQYVGYVRKYSVGFPDNSTFMAIMYETTIEATHEEYLLYDSSNFIGTVGGLMGLFLGFSFFDSGSFIIGKIFSKFSKNV